MADEIENMQGAYDEHLYDYAVGELKSGQFSESLWSKALAKSDFDEKKAKGKYVDLRVEQIKANMAFEKESAKVQNETKKVDEDIKNLERELHAAKWETAVSSPLLLAQIVIISAMAGFHQSSWIIFFVVIFSLFLSIAIPYVNNFIGIALAGIFGIIGYYLGLQWLSQTAGFWIGAIAFLVALGANIDALKILKE